MMEESAASSAAATEAAPFAPPATLVSLDGVPLAIVKTGALPTVLPFDTQSCTLRTLSSLEEVHGVPLTTTGKQWRWQAKVSVSLDPSEHQHWVLVTSASRSSDVCLPLADTTQAGIRGLSASLEDALRPLLAEATTGTAPGDLRVFLMSAPGPNKVSPFVRFTVPPSEGSGAVVNERVFLADTAAQLAHLIADALHTVFVEGRTEATAVFWPPTLPFPVNVHTYHDGLRVAEHEELLLPRRGLLRSERRVRNWDVVSDIACPSKDPAATGGFRTGAPWEMHLVTNPHTHLKRGPSPLLQGAKTLLTTGKYDFYHYRVDGYKDDGWGCAYRSLQTILSWFQHEGLMTASMPSLRDIQQILSTMDPDKAGRRGFVGSSEWIGSFEIMLVLQHYIPGLECTIKRLESATELDTDPVIQGLFLDHFSRERAAPVMIGGSSYAHTILGVHMNLETTEAQYLILDPHYSANPTNMKTAVNKGFVGWKEASKFFEASKWYNVCIPRAEQLDPR